MFVCVCMCTHLDMESEHSRVVLTLFYLYVGSKDVSWIVRLLRQLLPAELSYCPKYMTFKRFIFMSLHLCLYVHVCWSPQRPEEGVRYHRAGVPDRWEPPGMGAENQTDSLEEEQVLLRTEPCLQFCLLKFLTFGCFRNIGMLRNAYFWVSGTVLPWLLSNFYFSLICSPLAELKFL